MTYLPSEVKINGLSEEDSNPYGIDTLWPFEKIEAQVAPFFSIKLSFQKHELVPKQIHYMFIQNYST